MCSACAAHKIRPTISPGLGNPQKSPFFSGPATKMGVKAWPLRKDNFIFCGYPNTHVCSNSSAHLYIMVSLLQDFLDIQ